MPERKRSLYGVYSGWKVWKFRCWRWCGWCTYWKNVAVCLCIPKNPPGKQTTAAIGIQGKIKAS